MRILKKELWPHKIELDISDNDSDKIYDIEIWLGEQLGCFKDRWNAVYKHNGTDYYFKDDEFATLFLLRWS